MSDAATLLRAIDLLQRLDAYLGSPEKNSVLFNHGWNYGWLNYPTRPAQSPRDEVQQFLKEVVS